MYSAATDMFKWVPAMSWKTKQHLEFIEGYAFNWVQSHFSTPYPCWRAQMGFIFEMKETCSEWHKYKIYGCNWFPGYNLLQILDASMCYYTFQLESNNSICLNIFGRNEMDCHWISLKYLVFVKQKMIFCHQWSFWGLRRNTSKYNLDCGDIIRMNVRGLWWEKLPCNLSPFIWRGKDVQSSKDLKNTPWHD